VLLSATGTEGFDTLIVPAQEHFSLPRHALIEDHGEYSGLDAPLEQWQAYYQKSVALYAEIAEIDRGHHHEALYWAEREQHKAKEVADAIKEGTTSWNPFN
jgi:hypothetical protein